MREPATIASRKFSNTHLLLAALGFKGKVIGVMLVQMRWAAGHPWI